MNNARRADIPVRQVSQSGGLGNPPSGRADILVRQTDTPGGLENPPSEEKLWALPCPPADWFANPDEAIETHERRLPHWQQGAVLYFLTWRLADSIPREKLDVWHEEKEIWLRLHPKPWDKPTEGAYLQQFTKRIEEWLDAGEGSCVLRDPENAKIVADALLFFDGQRCDLSAFVVMPNHVHALVRLRSPTRLEELVKSWKGYTARQINQRLGIKGKLWQEEYWDRLVRDEEHWRKCLRYICRNPERAGLKPGEYVLFVRGLSEAG